MLPAPGCAHVYWFAIDEAGPYLPAANALLSREELLRSRAIARMGPRSEFVLARAAVRRLLGSILHCAPSDVPLRIDGGGKPHCAGLHFNLSHTRGRIAVAIASDVAVGVDVEWIDPAVDCAEVAASVFHPSDAQTLEKLDDPARTAEFFRLWTEREAIAKCRGVGLLDPAALRGEVGGPEIRTHSLDCGVAYAAAVAHEHPASTLTVHERTLSSLF